MQPGAKLTLVIVHTGRIRTTRVCVKDEKRHTCDWLVPVQRSPSHNESLARLIPVRNNYLRRSIVRYDEWWFEELRMNEFGPLRRYGHPSNDHRKAKHK
jgi:hypothetical protein